VNCELVSKWSAAYIKMFDQINVMNQLGMALCIGPKSLENDANVLQRIICGCWRGFNFYAPVLILINGATVRLVPKEQQGKVSTIHAHNTCTPILQ
jgi:sugar phosphate permease